MRQLVTMCWPAGIESTVEQRARESNDVSLGSALLMLVLLCLLSPPQEIMARQVQSATQALLSPCKGAYKRQATVWLANRYVTDSAPAGICIGSILASVFFIIVQSLTGTSQCQIYM